jgi:hypothetical protein
MNDHSTGMTYEEAFSWLCSQEGAVMSDTRAKRILSFARDAGLCPASSTCFITYDSGDDPRGYGTFRDPALVKRYRRRMYVKIARLSDRDADDEAAVLRFGYCHPCGKVFITEIPASTEDTYAALRPAFKEHECEE